MHIYKDMFVWSEMERYTHSSEIILEMQFIRGYLNHRQFGRGRALIIFLSGWMTSDCKCEPWQVLRDLIGAELGLIPAASRGGADALAANPRRVDAAITARVLNPSPLSSPSSPRGWRREFLLHKVG